MVSTESRKIHNTDVFCTEQDDGSLILLHLGTQCYYSLNETGTRVWRLIGEGLALNEVSRELEAQFDVSFEQAQECVVALANELVSEKLLNCVKNVESQMKRR